MPRTRASVDDSLNLRALANLTPRDQHLLRMLADMTLAPAALVARALFPSLRSANVRLRTLVARGMVVPIHVSPVSLPGTGRGARLLALTPAGAAAAKVQGAEPLTGAELQAAAVLAAGVVAVAEAYVTLLPAIEAGGVWTLHPDMPARGGKAAPEAAWVLARSASGREAAVFDLDLSGRTFTQVDARLRSWSAYRTAGGPEVCYVTPDAARRKRITELAKPLAGVAVDHPEKFAKRVFSQP